MNHLLFPIGIASLIAPTAHARLGETLAQLQERFGEPTSIHKEQFFSASGSKFVEIGSRHTFRDGDWQIDAVIIEGRSSKESYQKRGQWTDAQVETVLNANSQGAAWTETKPGPSKISREWRRADGGTAHWQQSLSLTVVHPAYERQKVKKEAEAKANASRPPRI